jgi:hypothetical protein
VADVGHTNTTLTLKEYVALVRYFNGVLCVPSVKIDISRGRDVWLMLFTPIDVNPRIELSKPLLAAEGASVSAPLSAGEEGLRFSLNAYGSGFKRAGLELVKRINTRTSLAHGLERVTVKRSWRRLNIVKASSQCGRLREVLQSLCWLSCGHSYSLGILPLFSKPSDAASETTLS